MVIQVDLLLCVSPYSPPMLRPLWAHRHVCCGKVSLEQHGPYICPMTSHSLRPPVLYRPLAPNSLHMLQCWSFEEAVELPLFFRPLPPPSPVSHPSITPPFTVHHSSPPHCLTPLSYSSVSPHAPPPVPPTPRSFWEWQPLARRRGEGGSREEDRGGGGGGVG